MIDGDITNCSVVGHGQISAYQCRMGYQVISADANTNTRQIKLQLEARTIDSRYTTTGYQLTPTIDGTSLTTIGMNFSKNNVNVWQVLGSKLITITGAFNGVKYGSFTTNMTAEWGLKSGSASVTINLENLHTPPVITTIITSEKNTLLNGSPQIVQYLSMKEIEFEVTTYDDATISSYQVHHNGMLIASGTTNGITINFEEVGTLATFEMEGKTWCNLKFSVVDSFHVVGSSEMTFEVTKYVKPNLIKTSSSIKRNGQLTGKVKMNLVGSFYSSSVNNIANTIKLKFAYWKKGEEESTTYYEIPFEPTGDSINLYSWAVKKGGVEITDVDKDFAYIFKVKATDYFNQESSIELLCPVGEYLWAEFKNRVDFKDITIKGLPVKSKFDTLWTGSFSPTTNNTYRGMTIDKYVYDYDFLLIDVSTSNSKTEKTTVVLVIDGEGIECGVRGTLIYLLESYRVSFAIYTDGYKTIYLKTQDLTNYNATDVTMNRIIGVKL